MARTLPQATDSTALGDIGPLRESFLRHLAAENKPEQFLAVARKIERSTGTGQPPSRIRMAEEYAVRPDSVRTWLQRRDWREVVPDKYRSE